jgi:hypothetical protein
MGNSGASSALREQLFRACRKLLALTAGRAWRSTLPSVVGGRPTAGVGFVAAVAEFVPPLVPPLLLTQWFTAGAGKSLGSVGRSRTRMQAPVERCWMASAPLLSVKAGPAPARHLIAVGEFPAPTRALRASHAQLRQRDVDLRVENAATAQVEPSRAIPAGERPSPLEVGATKAGRKSAWPLRTGALLIGRISRWSIPPSLFMRRFALAATATTSAEREAAAPPADR